MISITKLIDEILFINIVYFLAKEIYLTMQKSKRINSIRKYTHNLTTRLSHLHHRYRHNLHIQLAERQF